MKRLSVLLIMIVCLFVCFSSCKKEEPEIVQWKGKYHILVDPDQPSIPFEPAVAVWYTFHRILEYEWYPLKRFSTTEELKLIVQALNNPQQEGLRPELVGSEKLVLCLLERQLKKTRTVVVNFYLNNETQEFIGPKGEDKRLWKLLHDKERCDDYLGVPDPSY
jgi:hypothetical protein